MITAYLLLGTNLGDKFENLSYAIEQLGCYAGEVVTVSSIYKSEAWGFESENYFLNQCVACQTELLPGQLLEEILKIEKRRGRRRKNTDYEDRVLDIDILLYGHTVIEEADLTIPHPGLPKRKFALAPLSEIAPYKMHPVLRKTIVELYERCPDTSEIVKI